MGCGASGDGMCCVGGWNICASQPLCRRCPRSGSGTEWLPAVPALGELCRISHPSLSGISFLERVTGRARLQTSWNDEVSSCAVVHSGGRRCELSDVVPARGWDGYSPGRGSGRTSRSDGIGSASGSSMTGAGADGITVGGLTIGSAWSKALKIEAPCSMKPSAPTPST